jgi:stringent starvation protein B
MEKPLRPTIFKTLYEQCLDMYSGTPHITVLTSYPGVCLPSRFYNNDFLKLNIRPAAVHNWYCDDDALSFTTRFSGVSYNIYLPFGSILYMEDTGTNHQWIFPEEQIYADIFNSGVLMSVPQAPINTTEPVVLKSNIPHKSHKPDYLKLVVSNDNPLPSDKPKAKLTLVV